MSRIYFAIVNRGKANPLMKKVKKLGIQEGTVLLGEGTIRSKVLEPLGLNQTQKEVVMIPVNKQQDEELHKVISEEFHFDQKNKGIGFSVPFAKWVPGSSHFGLESDVFEYSLIMAIVKKGMSREIIKIAHAAKARGGTVIHGKGTGEKQDYYFPINVEPQKDTVLIVVNNKVKDTVQEMISKELESDSEITGVVFSLPVVLTSGIFEGEYELEGGPSE